MSEVLIKKRSKVLITQNQLYNIAGSEIVTLEVTEYFLSVGFEVSILTTYFGGPIKKYFDDLEDVHILDYFAMMEIDFENFDIVWINHNLLSKNAISALAEKNDSPIVVFNHMSHQIAVEWPMSYEVEAALADVVLYNAEEIRDNFHENGIVYPGKEDIFPNPAPKIFWDSTANVGDGMKDREGVLLVSNHPPEEILEALSMLEKDVGCKVTYRGSKTDKTDNDKQRISPQDLLNHRIVITIGKTVQYCIATNTPVYCYDHFGGPGLITEGNFKKAMYYNFAGRGFSKKSPDQITEELKNFLKTNTPYKLSDDTSKEMFYLPGAIERIIDKPKKTKKTILPLEQYQINIFAKQIEYRSILYRDSQQFQSKYQEALNSVGALKEQVDSKRSDNRQLNDNNKLLINENSDLKTMIAHLQRPLKVKIKQKIQQIVNDYKRG